MGGPDRASAGPQQNERKKSKEKWKWGAVGAGKKQDRAVCHESSADGVQNIGNSTASQRNPLVDPAYLISDSLKSHQNNAVPLVLTSQDCLLTLPVESY